MTRCFSILVLIAMALVCASCIDSRAAAARAAENRIMLVRERPVTLGYRRLEHESSRHADLANFLNRKGTPDFVAETSSGDRHYLILYYVEKKQAYACRTWEGFDNEIDFAGPYPISKEEISLLNGLQANSNVHDDSDMAADRIPMPDSL